jgi:type VI secretion system secreted protein Hcp
MAIEGFLSFELEKQGKNKGTGTVVVSAHKDKIPFIAFECGVISPRDVATGQATGKRQHGPVRIVKEWDANTPMLFQALVTNEQVKTAKFEFIRIDRRTGAEQVYFHITLTNGAVTNIQRTAGGDVDVARGSKTDSRDTTHVESVSFTFDKIVMEHLIDKTIAEDSLGGAR